MIKKYRTVLFQSSSFFMYLPYLFSHVLICSGAPGVQLGSVPHQVH